MIKKSLEYDLVGKLGHYDYRPGYYIESPPQIMTIDQIVIDVDLDEDLATPLISVEAFVPDETEYFYHFVADLPAEAVSRIMNIIIEYGIEFKRDL